jgi:hypothetical protein
MKQVISILLVFFIFFGCSKKSEESTNKTISMAADTSDLKTTPIDDLKDVYLTYKLEKGKTYKYKLTTISNDIQTILADTTIKQDVSQTISYLIKLDVKDVDSEGIMELDITFQKIKLNAIANAKTFNYESGTKMDSAEKSKYTEYDALVNNTFSARINKVGEIIEIFRADKIANKVIELRGLKDKVTSEEKLYLQTEITNIAIKPILSQIFRKLPEKKVSKDTTWEFPQAQANLQVMTLESTHTFKLKSFEKYEDDKIALIEGGINAKYTINPEAKKNNIEVKKPNFTAEGKIYFNYSKNLLQKSKTRTTLKVELSMQAPTNKGLQKMSREQFTINTNILELISH